MNTSEIVGKFLGIKRSEDVPCCSFCGKLQSQVKKLIAGPMFIFATSVLVFVSR
ncbi:MAG TPA: ClpX C4-type zinc finger protein [Pyrinomonadaceae bacterium]|nr:ClpX C4-type zinc finger protein [Pyrinomonadaceae bacterium]